MNISEMIQSRRKQLGLSLRELSERTKVSHTYIRDVENGKYAPSFDNALKLSKELDLDLKQMVIETYQSQLRQTLFQLIETCHKFELSIPYEQWVKSNLPIQPLSQESTKIHDAAFEIASLLYQEKRRHVLENKLALLKTLAENADEKLIYDILPQIINTISISSKVHGIPSTRKKVATFIDELNKKYDNLGKGVISDE